MVSDEFKSDVRKGNILKIRIMLKDSLLIDKSFSLFSELSDYAVKNGIEFFMKSKEPIKIADKPWTVDLMNYELTVLVNDFTKERLDYVKQIIRELYKGERQAKDFSSRPSNSNGERISQKNQGTHRRDKHTGENYETILREVGRMNKILQDSRDEEGNRHWLFEDIEKLQRAASNITSACKKLQRRK